MTRRPLTATLAAALLTASLGGGALAAAPALAAPTLTAATSTAAAPTAVGDSRPIAGSAATSRQIVAAWYARFLDAHFPIDRYPGSSY